MYMYIAYMQLARPMIPGAPPSLADYYNSVKTT